MEITRTELLSLPQHKQPGTFGLGDLWPQSTHLVGGRAAAFAGSSGQLERSQCLAAATGIRQLQRGDWHADGRCRHTAGRAEAGKRSPR